MPGRRRFVRDGLGLQQHQRKIAPPKPKPVPPEVSVLTPEVEAKLRAAGLRITEVTLDYEGVPASLVLTDTLGVKHGLGDLRAFADHNAQKNPLVGLLGGVLAEAFLVASEPDKTKRVMRQASHASGVVLKHLEQEHTRAKGGPPQRDQGGGDVEEPPFKGVAPCWFGGHDGCPTCRGCRRPGCNAIRCDCPKETP